MSKAYKEILAVSEKVISEQLASMNLMSRTPSWNWKSTDQERFKCLEANYKFKNFGKTWAFLNEVAREADKHKHHPTITTTYNRVQLILTTHDANNQITYKDLKLAQSITNIYNNDFDYPNKKLGVEGLIKESKERLSVSQASKMINEIVTSKHSKEHENKN